MIAVNVFLLIMNQTGICLAHNQKINCHYNHIPLNLNAFSLQIERNMIVVTVFHLIMNQMGICLAHNQSSLFLAYQLHSYQRLETGCGYIAYLLEILPVLLIYCHAFTSINVIIIIILKTLRFFEFTEQHMQLLFVDNCEKNYYYYKRKTVNAITFPFL